MFIIQHGPFLFFCGDKWYCRIVENVNIFVCKQNKSMQMFATIQWLDLALHVFTHYDTTTSRWSQSTAIGFSSCGVAYLFVLLLLLVKNVIYFKYFLQLDVDELATLNRS